MKQSKVTAAIVLLAAVFLTACGLNGTDAGSGSGGNVTGASEDSGTGGLGDNVTGGVSDSEYESANDDVDGVENGGGIEEAEPVSLEVFSQADAAVVPEIAEYSFEEAQEKGTVQALRGMLPGAAEGTWHTVTVDGVEYYYGTYDHEDENRAVRFGFAIFDDGYALTNGIRVGMTQEEILAAYPNMAVVSFDDGCRPGEGEDFREIPNLGWNAAAYPRSDEDMDSEWDYGGDDYVWTDQFDHLLIAEIENNGEDTLPLYLGLLIKDRAVAAITFYYPTAD